MKNIADYINETLNADKHDDEQLCYLGDLNPATMDESISDAIDEAIKKFKDIYKKDYNNKREPELKLGWYDDVTSGHSHSQYDENDKKRVIEEIRKTIDRNKNGYPEDKEIWNNLQGLSFRINSLFSREIMIIPIFDKETQKKLDKSVSRFADFMSNDKHLD